MGKKELAKNLGISEKLLLQIENDEVKISSNILQKLITVFDGEAEFLKKSWHSELTLFLGDQIKALRKSKGWSLEQLGIISGLSPTFLNEIERKSAIPSLTSLRHIADVFEVPVSLFLGNKRKCSLVKEKLIRLRKSRSMSQKELAQKAGVSPGLIGQLETDKVYPSFKTLEKISSALGVSVCALILEQQEVEEVIGALNPELRELLCNPKVQSLLGSICTMEDEKLKMVFNYIHMLNNPQFE